tara:strand:- start:275 stop:385 length:111 start_codon:yes stop_codon:yes gene_type:complete
MEMEAVFGLKNDEQDEAGMFGWLRFIALILNRRQFC